MPTLETRYLGELNTAFEQALDVLETDQISRRIWARDHTVWSDSPSEISNRLGWLDAPQYTYERLGEIEAVAAEVAAASFQHVVLIGMGGSSLGAEAIRATVPRSDLAPQLIVVDSTVPAWVQAVEEQIDLQSTLFLVASKSGTTAEVAALRSYFWQRTQSVLGRAPGDRFIAVTDPGSPLSENAVADGFRHVFLNPSNIGGRFSVLSYYGMVAAALTGVDIRQLLDHAIASAEASAASVDVPGEDAAVRLGAVLGAAARQGRNKLTLLASPAAATFGLWVEQLVAESTGKQGRGILPIAGEPVGAPSHYKADRLFVSLQIGAVRDAAIDDAVVKLSDAGQPVLEIGLEEAHELGAELFEWQFATAVASHLIDVHPFDQPDVESTKIETRALLDRIRAGETLQSSGDDDALHKLVEASHDADYLAIMGYLGPSQELETAVDRIRRALLEQRRLVTTFGYGPRFLHSTGQFHKGGPDGGLFLQLFGSSTTPMPLPGETYGLGELAEAQWLGDLNALAARQRSTVRVDLGDHPVERLSAFADELEQQLASPS